MIKGVFYLYVLSGVWIQTTFLRHVLAQESDPLSPSFSPLASPSHEYIQAPARPSITVIVGVLTTVFSVTFLILLYLKHCVTSRDSANAGTAASVHGGNSAFRRNSGIDRKVIDSLPLFRFASLHGRKEGLECAVCLNRFEQTEILRLLPKCKHAFHVECVDIWLESHSTCPLCRYRVDPEDVLLIIDENAIDPSTRPHEDPNVTPVSVPRRISRNSGRHSSAGEKTSSLQAVVVQKDPDARISVDGLFLSRKKHSESFNRSIGCFELGSRKDALLQPAERESMEKRLSHRIIVSESPSQSQWLEIKPPEFLFLQSGMLINDDGRFSSSTTHPGCRTSGEDGDIYLDVSNNRFNVLSGRPCKIPSPAAAGLVKNFRSISELTGVSRFPATPAKDRTQTRFSVS